MSELLQFLRLLSLNTTSTITGEDITSPGHTMTDLEDRDIHNDYLWLLILDLLIFIGLTIYAYMSWKKLEGTAVSADDFRPRFIRALIWANGGIYPYNISKSILVSYHNHT